MADEPRLKTEIESWLRDAKQSEAAREALGILFPKVSEALGRVRSLVESDGRQVTQRRLARREFAQSYFRLDPQPTSWGRSEMRNIGSAESPDEVFAGLSAKLNLADETERPRLRRTFLDALDAAFRQGKPLTQVWLDGIVSHSPSLIRSEDAAGDLILFSNMDRLRRLAAEALERLDKEERAKLLVNAIRSADDLSLLSEIVRELTGDVNSEGATANAKIEFFGAQTNSVRNLLLDRVRQYAHSGKIWQQADSARILWFWWGALESASDEITQFTSAAMTERDGFNALLEIPISLVRSTSGNYEHVSVSSWSKIIDLDRLQSLAEQALNSTHHSEIRERVTRFLDALKRGRSRPY